MKMSGNSRHTKVSLSFSVSRFDHSETKGHREREWVLENENPCPRDDDKGLKNKGARYWSIKAVPVRQISRFISFCDLLNLVRSINFVSRVYFS